MILTEIEIWFCPTFEVLLLWCVAAAGQCCQCPERTDCPLPPTTPGGFVLLEMATAKRMQREGRVRDRILSRPGAVNFISVDRGSGKTTMTPDEVPEFGTYVSRFYPEAPAFEGGVALSRTALARIQRDQVPAVLFERTLLDLIKPDVPDGMGAVWQEQDELRIVILPRPELYRGMALVLTVYRIDTRATVRR